MRLPADLMPESVLVVRDSREQIPLDLAPMPTVDGCLPTGDYALAAAPSIAVVERKSLPDLIACCGQERERFQREVDRLMAFPARLLIVEADWETIESGLWRGKVSAASVVGSLLGWQAQGLPVLLAGNHERAGRFAARFLYIAARREWRRLRAMVDGMQSTTPAELEAAK